MKTVLKITWVLLLFTLPFMANASTIYLFMVTANETGIGSVTDRQQMKGFIQQVGTMTGMDVEIKDFLLGDNAIGGEFNNLSPSSDDVVIFYYSGHGGNSGDGWPMFSANGAAYKSTRVYNRLKNEKQARLTLTIFDCCNHGEGRTTENRVDATRIGLHTRAKLALLFQKSKGDIRISAAAATKYAYGNANIGGYMTASLIEAITKIDIRTINDQRNIWSKTLELMKTETDEKCRIARRALQNPTVELSNVTTNVRGTNNGGSFETEDATAAPEDICHNCADGI
ncbi:MAG: caspase family protein [Aureispira sp.]|nr:caspase family protein [Aureispira sp.]